MCRVGKKELVPLLNIAHLKGPRGIIVLNVFMPTKKFRLPFAKLGF